MDTKDGHPEDAVRIALNVIGCKWKLYILRNLLERPWRFNELRRDLHGISQKKLTENLRSLEADGIINRKVFSAVPPRVVYSLSELGEAMRPLFGSIADWGKLYAVNHGAK